MRWWLENLGLVLGFGLVLLVAGVNVVQLVLIRRELDRVRRMARDVEWERQKLSRAGYRMAPDGTVKGPCRGHMEWRG